MKKYSLGIDIGGTFVDAILFNRETGETRLEKAMTTPENSSTGVLNAIEKLEISLSNVETIVHGTTLGLNAIIERRGAKTGLITNQGFRDILELGRGDLPADHMYDMHYQRPVPLVPRRCIVGVPGRITVNGKIDVELDEKAVIEAARYLVNKQGVDSIAVCCLHSYKNPQHEKQIARLVRETFPDIYLSVSHQVVREHREFERSCTTVLDAYVRSIFEKYIDDLDLQLQKKGFTGRFLIMRSSGGAMTAQAAKYRPLDSVLSGPAGGIIGAAYLSKELQLDQILTMDFGGTSLDTCVIDKAEPGVIHETRLQHMPVLIPTYDIRCIGAGGGSIAWLEEGMLRLGPQSAGSTPGPIAYARGGTQPTLTDAALALGFIDPENFLKGQLPLDSAAAWTGLESKLATPMNSEIVQTAAGIFSVLIAQTEGAVREITVEQGKDHKEFSILAFGGAGPLIAPLLALEMGIPNTIIPHVPAAFSAWGMLMSDLATDVSRTFVAEINDSILASLDEMLLSMEDEAKGILDKQGAKESEQVMIRNLEMRYLGQEHSLKIQINGMPDYDALRSAFDSAHEQRYGHRTEQPIELVNLRVTGLSIMAKPELKKRSGLDVTDIENIVSTRNAYCFKDKALKEFKVVNRELLSPGSSIEGPAIIDEGTSTTVIYTSQVCCVDDFGHLIIKTTI
ncbi:MAG: hydantoinase/oxoprolinase family protein [Gammaproteobacteria bacterium]|jgi:N-methylhydantoinase A|nr:hydantoinase/oxoprolinase family protein [Gammaproteobacteria bacterium]